MQILMIQVGIGYYIGIAVLAVCIVLILAWSQKASIVQQCPMCLQLYGQRMHCF